MRKTGPNEECLLNRLLVFSGCKDLILAPFWGRMNSASYNLALFYILLSPLPILLIFFFLSIKSYFCYHFLGGKSFFWKKSIFWGKNPFFVVECSQGQQLYPFISDINQFIKNKKYRRPSILLRLCQDH